MARRKISTSVYLDPPQLEALRARSARTGEPYAAIVRRALDRELAPEPIHWFEFLAHAAPDFFDSLTPKEFAVLHNAGGVL